MVLCLFQKAKVQKGLSSCDLSPGTLGSPQHSRVRKSLTICYLLELSSPFHYTLWLHGPRYSFPMCPFIRFLFPGCRLSYLLLCRSITVIRPASYPNPQLPLVESFPASSQNTSFLSGPMPKDSLPPSAQPRCVSRHSHKARAFSS